MYHVLDYWGAPMHIVVDGAQTSQSESVLGKVAVNVHVPISWARIPEQGCAAGCCLEERTMTFGTDSTEAQLKVGLSVVDRAGQILGILAGSPCWLLNGNHNECRILEFCPGHGFD